MKILLANPRGFCAGVDRAIDIVNRALEKFGPPIYVRHEVVHNKYVVETLKSKGAVFVDEVEQVPDNATVIFSAHGVSQQVRQEARARKLTIFDATCPLVTKVHMEVVQHCKAGRDLILIGHQGHPEVEGTLGQWDETVGTGTIYLIDKSEEVANLEIKQPGNLAYVTQTTLSVDDTADVINALKNRFPEIRQPRREDICYATQNRQNAVRELAALCDLVLVVGSPNSSNSNRLRELAEKCGREAYLVDDRNGIKTEWLTNKNTIGITAGASAPESLVQDIVLYLKELGATDITDLKGEEETIVFALPKPLRINQG